MKSHLGLGRNIKQVWENLYMLMSILVVIFCVVAIIFSSNYPITFTVCFFLAAVMQLCHGNALFCINDKHKRAYIPAIIVYITAIALCLLGVISIGAL